MLSLDKLKEYYVELNNLKDYCQVIMTASHNVKSKLKKNSYLTDERLDALIGKPTATLEAALDRKTTIACFLLYISAFEKICFHIYDGSLKKTKEFVSKNDQQKRAGSILLKTIMEFYSFSEIKKLFGGISSKDKEYLAMLICSRNYFAHGEKNEGDLNYDKKRSHKEKESEVLAMIANLDEVHEQCKELLKYLI